MLTNLFAAESLDTDDKRRVFAKALLKGYLFLFAEPEAEKNRGLFRSPPILEVFSSHWVAIRGHVNVPPEDVDPKDFNAKGALALSAAAVGSVFELMLWLVLV
jgi:hypothetical protein